MANPTEETLLSLRTQAKYKADMVNSQFVTDEEWNDYINKSYYELYDILIAAYGNDYHVAVPYSFTTTGSTMFYDLPEDFYKLLGVDLALSPGSQDSYVTIRRFKFSDRNRYATPNFQSFYGVTNLRYRLKGNQLWLTPIPVGGSTIQMWYIPKLTPLTNDTDTVDSVSGWTEYITTDAAIKALNKEESDTTALMMHKQELLKRIEGMAEDRDAGEPEQVGDVQSSDFWWPNGNSGSGNGSY